MKLSLNFENSFLVKTQNTILSAAFILAIATAANAFLGLIKSRLLTTWSGVSDDLSVFYIADRIPSLLYSVLVTGAISTIFITVFADELKRNKPKAFDTASSVINTTLVIFAVFTLIAYILSPQLIKLLTLNKVEANYLKLGSEIMRILLLSQILLVSGSLITSVLQAYKHFLMPALALVLYNLGMIFGVVLLGNRFGIMAAAYGVLAGSVVYFLLQIPSLSATGFRYRPRFLLTDNGVKEMINLIPPRLLSVFLANLVATANNSFAILISAPAVIYLKFAIQLQTLPVNLFGLSIASASLPTLSAENDSDNLANFKKTFLTSLHQMFYLVIPASIILLVLRIPVVRLVYGVAQFPWEATVKTSYVLAFFSIGIFSQSANYLITRAFYALKDTVTPVKVSLITACMNIAITAWMIIGLKLGIWSAAFSFTVTSIIDTVAMIYLLNKKVGGFDLNHLITPFTKIAYSAVLMGITLCVPIKLLDKVVFDTTRTVNLILLTGVAGFCGMITYLVFTWLLKVEEIELLYTLLRRLNITKVEKVSVIDQ